MSIRLDIGARLREGRQLARAAYRKEEASKTGVLRAGNSGIMSDAGDVAGSCHRIAHLRSLGIQVEEPDDPTLMMFQIGTANEHVIYEDLSHTKGDTEIVLREHEIPIEWITTNGTRVTGRPDFVICERVLVKEGVDIDDFRKDFLPVSAYGNLSNQYENQPRLVLEAKSVASVWVARTVFFDLEPKVANLAQAGHYMWKLGVPGRLMYKQYAIQAVPELAFRFLPREGEARSEYIEYDDRGNPRTIRPFEIVYELQFNKNGVLQYKVEGTRKWRNSIVSIADIERFYEFTSKMGTGDLGPRPLAVKPDGEEMSYKPCKYCPLKNICQRRDLKAGSPASYHAWLDQVRQFVVDSKATNK